MIKKVLLKNFENDTDILGKLDKEFHKKASMRLKILSAILFVIIASSGTTYSQDKNLEITVEVKHTSGLLKKDGEIVITIISGTPKYKYQLYNELPDVDIQPIYESTWKYETIETIGNLSRDTYFILVYDESEKAALKKIEITISKN